MSSEKNPFITVCMPVYNESAFIETTIYQLLNQDYPENRFEIIVADGMSQDNTRQIIKGIQKTHPQIQLYENPKRKSSSGRNIGYKKGKGDIFVVVDGHCHIPDTQLFNNIVDCFDRSGAHCLGRPQPLDPPDITPFQSLLAAVRNSKIGHGGDSLIYSDYEGFVSPVSHGAIYKKEVFNKIGYVDESFDACEDVEFNVRVEKAGFKTYMSPSLAIKYYPRRSTADLFKQMLRYGKGRVRLVKKHPDTFSIPMMVPLLFVIGILLTIATIPISFPITRYMLIPFCLYFFIVLFSTIAIKEKRPIDFIYAPVLFPTIHIGLGFGQLIGIYQILKSK